MGPAGPVAPVDPGIPCGPWSGENVTATCGVIDSTTINVVILLHLQLLQTYLLKLL